MIKPSVTQILSEIYPFDPAMFINSLSEEWLNKKREKWQLMTWWIADKCEYLDYDKVMYQLNQLGSTVHLAWYDLWAIGFTHNHSGTIYEPYIKSVTKFWNDYKPKMIYWEKYLEWKHYVWICDAVLQVWNETWLIDYKTWWAYKYIYWIKQDILNKNWTPKKPSDINKVSVQLSMYEDILPIKIDKRKAIWITEIWYFIFDIDYNIKPFQEWLNPLPLTLI